MTPGRGEDQGVGGGDALPAHSELGLLRVAAASPELRVADVEFNTAEIIRTMADSAAAGCRLILFPELSITGYSCGDLFYQSTLIDAARDALLRVAAASAELGIAAVVGLPVAIDGRLFSCAAVAAAGGIAGVVPKTFLPNTNEFYESRWFTSADRLTADHVTLGGAPVPCGRDLLFPIREAPGCVIGVEICEDLWAVDPPSSQMALGGATLLLNLSASNELVGKAAYRRELAKQQSARCLAAYVFAGAGPGESSTDLLYGGHSLAAENGRLLAETRRFEFTTQVIAVDLDFEHLAGARLKSSSYSTAPRSQRFRRIDLSLPEAAPRGGPYLIRSDLTRTPFVPLAAEDREAHFLETLTIQATALAKRLRHVSRKRVGGRHVTLGVSGGVDSALALLVAVRAFDLLELPRQGIVAVTMPGFGTTSRTRGNADALARSLGVTLRTIPIEAAVSQHFRDIDHDEGTLDVTFQNAQARERTQILMDVAQQVGGFNVGTADLSELALGDCSFNADQMSMYHVNAGVPKTLVRAIVQWAAERLYSGETSSVLRDICATPMSPELLPRGDGDSPSQITERIWGPYELHDFFLFHVVRHAFGPRKVFALACVAFDGSYRPDEIAGWLYHFYWRFFASQYKRSAMPDGPKVGPVALSPRGDWRMPSDAVGALWLGEAAALRGPEGSLRPSSAAAGAARPVPSVTLIPRE